MIVYEADAEGNRGGIIWQGKISAGERVKIISNNGHFRYQYKMNPDEGYEGDTSADCYQEFTILVD